MELEEQNVLNILEIRKK